jgi:hypothetical protein
MMEGGGSSTNRDCDEILILSFDLKASRKQGCIAIFSKSIMAWAH